MSINNQSINYIADKYPSSSQNGLLRKILSYDFQTQKSILEDDPSIIHQTDAKTKNTLLFYSVRNDNYPLTEYLIEKNANINIQNSLGETPLHKAVENGTHKMINSLLDKGANPNLQQEFGETPMHIAASKGDYKVIKLLLLYQANPSILTNEGYLAEDYAKERGNHKCVDVLSKALNQGEISDIFSPVKVIREQFENGTYNSPMNSSTQKKKTVDLNKYNQKHNIAISNPSDDELQNDCDNFRYNGLQHYNRTPNHMGFNDNTRAIYSNRKFQKIRDNNYDEREEGKGERDNDCNNNNPEEEEIDDYSEDNAILQYKLPFEKMNASEEVYLNKNNHSSREIIPLLSTLISATEPFIEISKEQIIFYSEKNDIIEEIYLRQSTTRVSFRKNNTLKNSKFIQNTYQDEFLEDQEHNYNNHQLETIEDNTNLNNNFSTTEHLNVPPCVVIPDSMEEKELYDYLKIINMEEYSDLLIKQGFDDLNILLAQMKTKKGITDTNFKDAGITKSGHRARILLKLQIDAGVFEPRINEGNAFYYSIKELSDYTNDDNLRSMYQWLYNIKLNCYYANFYLNGYHSIDLLYLQTLSKYIDYIMIYSNRNPLTEEILEQDIKIPKLGYRLRIINKLIEDSIAFQNRMRINTISDVDYQNEMKNQSCRCHIF